MTRLTRELIGLLLFVALVSAGIGYLCGLHDGGWYVLHAQERASYVECDTDTDCIEKNGCGGYADPCEEAKQR